MLDEVGPFCAIRSDLEWCWSQLESPRWTGKCADLLVRHLSATDLLLGGVTEVLREFPEADPDNSMAHAVFSAITTLHEGVRRRVIQEYPDLDYDDR